MGSNCSRDAVGQQSQANCSHSSCLCSPSSKIGSSPPKGCGGNCGPGGKQWQPTAGCMTHVTFRLTAKNRDQLRNPIRSAIEYGLPLPFTLSVLSLFPSLPSVHLRSRSPLRQQGLAKRISSTSGSGRISVHLGTNLHPFDCCLMTNNFPCSLSTKSKFT